MFYRLNMKVSIIIPCYKGESFVADILQDVVQQTYQNWELIVVGNGLEQEAQKKIVDKFLEKDNRIRYVSVLKKGVSYARNRGIDESSGEWIAFVDVDDRLPANWMERFLSHSSRRPDIITGGIVYRNTIRGSLVYDDLQLDLDEVYSERPEEFVSVYLSNMAVSYSPCTKMYNARFLKESGIRFKENISVYEDGIFNLELLSVCNSICFFRQTGYEYCLHPESSAIGRFHPKMEQAVFFRRLQMLAVLRRGGFSREYVDFRMAQLLLSDSLDIFLNEYRRGSMSNVFAKRRLLKSLFASSELHKAFRIVRPSKKNLPLVLFRFFYFIRMNFVCVVIFHILFVVRKIWR